MPYLPSAFQRLLEPVDRHVFASIVERHDGNRGVGTGPGAWTCQRHLKALVFAQIAGLKSLREIEQALAARPEALYHLGLRLPKRSTLSDASAARPVAVFADLARYLMGLAARKLRAQGKQLIELIDTSPIPLRDLRFAWAEAGSRVRGLNMYVHYDPSHRCPVHFDLTSPKTADVALVRDRPLEPNVICVFDKAFTDYSWWQDICDAGAIFVTRLKRNAKRREVTPSSRDLKTPVVADNTVKIGNKKPRGGAENPLYDTTLREIVVDRGDHKTPLHLITNDLKSPPEAIARLYRLRWQIELFFKWIKQNLRVKAFFGRSENAVKTQLYAAIIAMLLLKLFRQTYAKTYKAATKLLMARLKVALLSPFDLRPPAKPPPGNPKNRPPDPQMSLKLI